MSLLNPDTTIEGKELSISDSITFMSDESNDAAEVIELDDKKPADKEPKKAAKSDDSDDESEESDEDEVDLEDEDEDSEEDEEDLELVTPVRRKEILAKYPNLFKDFPYLQKAYYLEQKYSEILPTIEDAQQAVEKAGLLDTYEKEIMEGSTESILSAVRDGDKEAFAKVVDNYLPTLFKVDEQAYYHTIGNIVKHTIISMVRDGKENDATELVEAAEVINQYVFGTKKFTAPAKMSKDEISDGKSKASEREQQFIQQQFESAKGSITTKIDNVIKSTVDKNIDPNSSMTDYVKRTASREVIESLDSLMQKDTRFVKIYDRLWERAATSNFSTESMDKIKSAYLSKAKTLLPVLIKRARGEALRGLRRAKDSDDINTKDRKGPLPVGKTRSSASSPNSSKTGNDKSKSSVPRDMTSLEYLMSD